MVFTHEEKCDIMEAYIFQRKNTIRAREHYSAMFPERAIPQRRYFLELYRQFRRNEEVFKKNRTKKQFVVSEEVEINVLGYFEAHPNNSIRELAREIDLSLGTIHKILKKYNFEPYKYRPVQTLHLNDDIRRMEFCEWFLHKCEDPNFPRYVLWSDESNFSNKGMFNRKNYHFWSRENPFLAHPTNPQHRFSLNVWCGMIGSKIVGPFFYRGSLTGERYEDFMSHVLEDFVDNVNLMDRPRIYFQQDGAPAHNHHIVNALLERLFGPRWIGTHGPVLWPPRSPDLTPLDFFYGAE